MQYLSSHAPRPYHKKLKIKAEGVQCELRRPSPRDSSAEELSFVLGETQRADEGGMLVKNRNASWLIPSLGLSAR